jgi:hypothetical protein
MEDNVARINNFYKLIEHDLENDFFLFPFMELVIELLLGFKLISDKGMGILSREIELDFENLKKNIDVNKHRLWICLYFLCVFHLSKCFVSFVEVMMVQDVGKYGELRNQLDELDAEILVKLVDVKERAKVLIDIAKNIMDKEVSKIEDDTQAKLFDEHKRKCIDKPNYFPENPLYVPADHPEGVAV